VGAFKIRVFGLRSVATTQDCFEREIVAATDQAISGVPGRYAAALFELAAEAKAIDKISDGLSNFSDHADGISGFAAPGALAGVFR
jgi:hypothetical protein